MKIAANARACTGCRMCEMACSFHHHGIYSSNLSNIKITMHNTSGEIDVAFTPNCKACQSCVQACHFGALETVEK